MTALLDCVALIDDSAADNFVHKRAVKKAGVTKKVVVFEDARDALADLVSGACRPDLIFLDINMPGMNGWEFLEAYQGLEPEAREATVVVMLTTSANPADRQRASDCGIVGGFCSKPLTAEQCRELVQQRFGLDLGET